MSASPYRLVLCTCPNMEVAETIAGSLIGDRLAACVNILPGVRSVYLWQGKVETDDEHLLLVKTRTERLAAVQQAIVDRHPYELPEVIAVAIDEGLPDYLAWIGSSVEQHP